MFYMCLLDPVDLGGKVLPPIPLLLMLLNKIYIGIQIIEGIGLGVIEVLLMELR